MVFVCLHRLSCTRKICMIHISTSESNWNKVNDLIKYWSKHLYIYANSRYFFCYYRHVVYRQSLTDGNEKQDRYDHKLCPKLLKSETKSSIQMMQVNIHIFMYLLKKKSITFKSSRVSLALESVPQYSHDSKYIFHKFAVV